MNKTLFAKGSFITEDQSHKFIVAAVVDSNGIKFGVSFCHPNDSGRWNEELGKVIAKGRALSDRTTMEQVDVSNAMLMPKKFMGTEYINECLRRLCQVVEQNPGQYCKAYAKINCTPSKSYSFSDPTDYKLPIPDSGK